MVKHIFLLGVILIGSAAFAKDKTPPIAELEKNCSVFNEVSSCNQASDYYWSHKRTKENIEAAKRFSEKACELNDGHGCIQLGYMLYLAPSKKPNPLLIFEAFEKACSLGNLTGCHNKAGCYYLGVCGKEISYTKAYEIYVDGCNASFALSCTEAGAIQADHLIPDSTSAQAISFLKRGCDLGDGSSCYGLGLYKRRGDSLPHPVAVYMARACALGQKKGCRAPEYKKALKNKESLEEYRLDSLPSSSTSDPGSEIPSSGTQWQPVPNHPIGSKKP